MYLAASGCGLEARAFSRLVDSLMHDDANGGNIRDGIAGELRAWRRISDLAAMAQHVPKLFVSTPMTEGTATLMQARLFAASRSSF